MSGPVSENWDEIITFHGIPFVWDKFCPKCGRDYDLDPSPHHKCPPATPEPPQSQNTPE